MTLKDIKAGQSAIITSVGGEKALRHHLLDMGLIQGTQVTVVKYAPMGDPVELRVHDYELTIRLADAEQIEVELPKEEVHKKKKNIETIVAAKRGKKEHPGLGEGGKFHDRKAENPLPEGTKLTFALVGNQNCGKTTLFNQLTGSNQHVGNFPGVTVDRKDGVIKGHPDTLITDLPGIYSMSPYSAEEVVTREFVLRERPKGIINIIDATNIERNLYLTLQLMELDVPMVVALNMMDEVKKNHGTIRINELEEFLGVPVIPIAAIKGEGIAELVDHAIHVAKYQESPGRVDFCGADDENSAVHRCIHGLMHLIEDHAIWNKVPVRFAASKFAEGDMSLFQRLSLSMNEYETIQHMVQQMEVERGLDRESAIADMRYKYILKVCEKTVVKPQESREHKRSREMDRILTGRYTGIPMFIGIMGLVFYLTFNVVGAYLQGLLETVIEVLTERVDMFLVGHHINETLRSLVVEGIFQGVGSVVSFLPIIVTLFFFLSLLEDSGYMARVAFIMDKIMRRFGLSGRSIVPMLVGFGCTVPGVMASRTLSSERDRKMTILLTPFMSCSAKLPIYAFFSAVFFPEKAAIVMVALYVFGIVTGVLFAFVLKGTIFKGEPVPFVMELPNYRLPGAKNVLQLLWDKAKDFLQRAFSVIFLATIIIWFLQNFDLTFNQVVDSSTSILAMLAGVIAPIFAPLGFGDWRMCTALLSGFLAKESVVSTMYILFGSTNAIHGAMTNAGAAAFLVFCLLYTPCVAAIASIRQELGARWSVLVVFTQCAIAWLAGFIIYLLFSIM